MIELPWGSNVSSKKSQNERAAFSQRESNHYKLLGVPQTATFKEITAAYRDAMKRVHPDRQRPDQRAIAEEKAKELNKAYTTLSKSESRRAYDAEIRADAIQDQIMNRYVGGFAPGGPAGDQFAESLKRQQTRAERAEQRRADRSATASMFLVFAGIAVVVIVLLVLLTLTGALISALT